MAENTEKKVLIDVEVKATEALKSYAALKLAVEDLKKEQTRLKEEMAQVDTSTETGAAQLSQMREEYEMLGQQVKAYNKEAKAQETTIQKNIQLQSAEEGSINQLRRQLELAAAEWTRMSGSADASTEELRAQQQAVAELKEKLNKAEQAYGTFTGQVGNYALAGKSIRKEMRDLTEELVRMRVAGEEDTAQFKEMTAHLETLKDAFADVGQGSAQMASDTDKLDASKQILGVAANSFSGLQFAMASGAESSKEYLEVMKNMQIALMALSALTTVQNSIQKQTIAYTKSEQLLRKLGIAQTIAQSKAEAALNVAKGNGSIVTKAAAAAQWLWNAALAANPVILIAMAVIALIAGITALIKILDSSSRAEKEAAKASEAYEKQARKTADTITEINNRQKNETAERNNRLREEIIEMKKHGASAEAIAKVRAKAEQDLRDTAVKASQERVKQQQTEQRAMEKSLQAEQKVLDIYLKKKGEQSEKYKDQKKKVDDLTASLRNLKQAQVEELQMQIDSNLSSVEATQKAAEEQRKKYQDNALKSLDAQKKLQDEQNKLAETGMSQDFLIRQRWEEKKFIQSQTYEKTRLDQQRKFGQITRKEYENQYNLLDAQEQTFRQGQLSGLQDYYSRQSQIITSLAQKSVDEQIAAIERKYKKASEDFRQLNAIPVPQKVAGQSDEDYQKKLTEWESFKLRQEFYELGLERHKAEEIEKIRNDSLATLISGIETRTLKSYDDELAKFTDNEREKNRIEIEMAEQTLLSKKIALKKQLADNAISQSDYDREIYESEAELRALQSQQNQLALNSELLSAGKNAKAQYEMKKAYLEKEMELYAGNADKQKEIAASLVEIEKEYLQSRMEAFEEWSGKVTELMSGVNSLMAELDAAQTNNFEEKN
jgi:chromosome segregation ATPase